MSQRKYSDAASSSTAPPTNSEALFSAVEALMKRQTTIGGVKYYAVTPDAVAKVQRRVDRALAGNGDAGDVSPTKLMEMSDQIDKLIAENKKLVAAELEAKKQLDDLMGKLTASRTAKDEATKAFARWKDEHQPEAESLKSQLADAEHELEQVKKAVREAKKTSDVDAAKVLESARTEGAAAVRLLKDQLAAYNRQLAQAIKDRDDAIALTTKLDSQVTALKGEHAQLKNAILSADERKGDIELRLSPTIEKLLGKDACLILSKWHTTAYDDVKERAYVGMTALQGHHNKLLASMAKLFKQIWQWAKTQSYNARKALLPWFQMILEDLNAGKIRTVRFYRNELEKLILIVKEKKEQRKQQAHQAGESPPTDTWFSDLWFYGYAITLRIRRRTKGTLSGILNGCSYAFAYVKTWAGHVVDLFTASKKGREAGMSTEEVQASFLARTKLRWNRFTSRATNGGRKGPGDTETLFDAEGEDESPILMQDLAPEAQSLD